MAGIRTLRVREWFGGVLVACLAQWPLSAAAQEASLRCIYGMMTSARAAIEFCGERLDDASIRTFSDLQPALKKFINENAKSEQYKIAPGDDENVRERYRRRGRADICEGEGLRVSKALLPLILADESVMKIRKRLESPSDPMLGDAPCL